MVFGLSRTLAQSGVAIGLAAGLMASAADEGKAHPHVWVTARTELVFSGKLLESVRHVWQFDEAFTSFAIQGLDTDENGSLSQAELQPLAKVNIESLQEYGFFTFVGVGETEPEFTTPSEYWLDFTNGRLTLFYTLPLATPIGFEGGEMTVEVFDPTYFVEFEMAKEDPVLAANLPAGCNLAFEKPKEIAPDVAARLAELPATMRDIPAEFMEVTETRSNKATVTCG